MYLWSVKTMIFLTRMVRDIQRKTLYFYSYDTPCHKRMIKETGYFTPRGADK